jgi:multisubunit Na+/H+ antiporter MnhE subunit
MKSAIKWIAGIMEDKNGSASSKRFVLFICLYFFWMLVRGSLEGKPINDNILFTVGGIILFLIGAVTSEFFKK